VIWLRHGRRAATGHAHRDADNRPPRRHAPSWLPEPGSAEWSLTGRPEPDDLIVDAPGWDGCFGSDLERTLRAEGFEHLVLAGYASEVTVDSTVRALNDRGFECLVLSDGCAPLDAELGARALRSLTMSGGIFGAHGRTADLLAALERTASAAPAGLAPERTVA
jgi:nicotinamidase-related amidase